MNSLAMILETVMIISFGASWPMSIAKSIRAKTAKGKSLPFLVLIDFGYVCGIGYKAIAITQAVDGGTMSFLLVLSSVFYVLNLLMVTTEIVLYFHNKKYDRAKECT